MNNQIYSLLSIYQSIIWPYGFVYLSSPVTGGKCRLYLEDDVEQIIKYNTLNSAQHVALAVKAMNSLQLPTTPIICAPVVQAEFDNHKDWMRFWLTFLSSRVSTIFLAPGWEESAGCTEEALFAVRNKIPVYVLTIEGNPIPLGELDWPYIFKTVSTGSHEDNLFLLYDVLIAQ